MRINKVKIVKGIKELLGFHDWTYLNANDFKTIRKCRRCGRVQSIYHRYGYDVVQWEKDKRKTQNTSKDTLCK